MPFRRNCNSKLLIRRYFQAFSTMEGAMPWSRGLGLRSLLPFEYEPAYATEKNSNI